MEKFNAETTIKNIDFPQELHPFSADEVKEMTVLFSILGQIDQRIKKEQKTYGNQSK